MMKNAFTPTKETFFLVQKNLNEGNDVVFNFFRHIFFIDKVGEGKKLADYPSSAFILISVEKFVNQLQEFRL